MDSFFERDQRINQLLSGLQSKISLLEHFLEQKEAEKKRIKVGIEKVKSTINPSKQPKLIKEHNVDGIELCGWRITASKSTILKSDEMEAWTEKLYPLKVLPEMVFGGNTLTLTHSSGFWLSLNAFDALKSVDHDEKLPKVCYSEDWLKSKKETELTKKIHEYNWTFTTYYKGTIQTEKDSKVAIEETNEKIDIQKLKRPDPILFYDEIHLFEDELGDNGTSTLDVKVRVMPSCFFVLMRFWLRIDNVLFRCNDTRIYQDFDKDYILREFQHRESSYKSIAQMVPDTTKHRDPNIITPLLKIKNQYVEKIPISGK